MKTTAEKIAFLKSQPHKGTTNPEDWHRVKTTLLDVAIFYVEYCLKWKLPILFTSIIRPMIPGVSKTDIHGQRRAFDGSAKGWTKERKDDFLLEGNKRFKNIGAVSISDRQSRAFIFHGGTADHLHAQVRS